ncbi:MAG TPA: asparagine synthase-related protein, partial [Chthonomonadaceae bacterium]|nr:asparagine synthase-related protein [Chthonomonadaceae bacterium]
YGYPGANGMALLSTLLPFVPAFLRPALGGLAGRCAPGSRLQEALRVAASPAGTRKAALYREEARRLWADLLPGLEEEAEKAAGRLLGTWFEEGAPKAYIDEAHVLSLMHENCHSVTIAGDLPAMAASVEARCPFLDQELVQRAWQTHYRLKTRGLRDRGQNKWILKKALEGRVPNDLLYAAKRGFGYHIQEEAVLRGPWKPQVDRAFDGMDALGGLLNVAAARRLKRAFDDRAGVPAMLIAKLYALAAFQNL